MLDFASAAALAGPVAALWSLEPPPDGSRLQHRADLLRAYVTQACSYGTSLLVLKHAHKRSD